jgi:general secretion pathway protein J
MNKEVKLQGSYCSGFTLIEMLVVLVILSMTTTLLIEGMSNTWNNFEKLGARDLSLASGQLPQLWLGQSISSAVLYHPHEPSVIGKSNYFEFITTRAPNDSLYIPQKIFWAINNTKYGWTISFTTQTSSQPIVISRFDLQPTFEYLTTDWTPEFKSKTNALPRAVRIRVSDLTWLIAKPSRPMEADVPVELPLFGEYEF